MCAAGVPNYQKLYEMGKLPDSARKNIPLLAKLDAVEKRLDEIKESLCALCLQNVFGEWRTKEELKPDLPSEEIKPEIVIEKKRGRPKKVITETKA